MSEYSIQQKQFISAYRNSHQVPVILNDDAVVEMIKEEMIKSGKVYPEFASLLDTGKSAKTGKAVSVFETVSVQTEFISDKLEKTTQKPKTNKKKTYLPQEKALARKYMAEMLKNKIYEAIFGEQGFNVIANPNKISGSEAWQELEVIGAGIVHGLNLGHLGINEPLNRKDLSKSLNAAFRQIEELETLVNVPDKFDKKYKEITRKEMDYSVVIDYMKAVNEHQSSYLKDKLSTLEKLKEPAERFEKTLNIPAVKNFNKWAGRQETAGSLTGLAVDMALAYMSGGMSAASNAAMKVGQGVTKAVTEQAVKSGIKREAAAITGQVAGITSSQITGAGLNAAMFQATRIAGALEDGNFTAQELDAIGASYISLFKFGYVGSAISGPLGAKFGEWAGRLINNEKIVSVIINASLNKPTTLGKLLTNLSEHTGIVQKATEFGTSFVINTEYMAQDEGISFEEALTNLAQMEGVSKIVMAFLGGKTTRFLTPEKVQKITTEIENCKVEIAVYRGQKAIKVTTPEGKENFFATHEELIAFVADRVYTEAGVNSGVKVNIVKPAPQSTQPRNEKISPAPQSQANPKTLEGGVKDTELTEVAPFSERLNKNLTPDDLIPERKTVELKNGELTPEGEFKSDGTRTVSETPFGKSETFKTMPDGKEKAIATTPKELKTQILSIIGGKKLSQNVRNNIDNLLKNPEVTIKDISEVIETLRYIEPKSTYAADFIISAIRRIENFQNFKTNLYTYAQFSTEMNNGYLKSARSYTWEPYSSKIQNFLRDRMNLEQLLKLDKTEPEALSQNIAKFSELGFILKETICYDRTNFSEYMFKSHSDKYFERLDYINEFNRAQYENKSKQFYTNIVTRGGLEDDANFAIINKNIEAYKSSLPYTGGQESLLYNSSTKEAEWLADFEAKIPEEKRTVAYNKYHWMVREDASKEIIDKYAEFIKAMPKEMLEGLENIRSHYPQYYENVFDSFHHIGYRQYKTHTQTPDELIIRAKILAKCPSLAGRNGFKGFDSFKVSEFLCQTELKNSAAVLEFVDKAEPSALSKYHLDKESSNNKNFAEIMNEADLDLWTKNAKLHNELNPKYREHLNTGESLPVIGGWNEKFDFCYDLPTKEFKTRIDAINEYTEKLDMKTLDYVYVGKIKPKRRILDVLTQLKPEVIENIDSYNSEKYINNLSDYSDNGLKNFVTFANKYADQRDLIRNINSESFRKIMNDLSENEIDILNKNILTHEHSSYFDPDTEMIKKRIASIPDKVKKYYRDKDNYLVEKYYGDRYFNEDGSLKENSPFKYLDTLSDTELKAIGTKAISEFVDRSVYSWSSVKEFDKERLKALTELPEQLLTKLEEGNKYSLLTKEEFTIDVQKITARYNDLVKFARFEELPGRIAGDICTMPDYSFNILKDVLKAHNDKLSTEDFDSICELIPRQDNFSQQEINYIREQLIHNPKNNPKDISRELQFLYSKYSTLASKPENRSFQKEILEDLINRGSKDNVQIERILQWIGNKEIETAKIVYDCALTAWEDPAVNPAEIGELISAITDNCEDFAYKAFHHPKFIGKKDKIHDILTHLKDDNKDFAGFMYLESDRFSVEDGNRILRSLTKENREFIENLCREGILSGKSIAKITEYTTCKNGNLGQAEKLLSSPEIKKWAEENINNNIDVETVIHLGRTQKNLYLEARQIQKAQDAQAKKEAARTVQQQNVKEEVFADVDAVETITKALAELNVPEGMAKNAYAKLCVDSSGNVDKIKLDAAKSLIKAYGFYTRVNKKGQTAINPNLTPKDITEIFKLATGDKMSTQNGMFRPHIIKDIITLKECGIDDIRFAMNLASIKNMDLIEMKARFKGETRQDIAHRIDALVSNKVKETLNSRGIDLEEIREKALTSDRKIEDVKFKEGHGKAEVRTLDSIVGTEALVLTKFKDKIGPEIWQSKEAFKDWADKKLADITDWKKHPEYKSVDYPRYNEPRESGLQKWADFLKSEESGVQNDVFAQILFIDGITKEMKPDNAYTPPAISREIFEHTYNELLAGNTNVSITKEYAELNRKKAIEKYGTPTISEDGIKGTWVKIPRSQKGEPLYDEHVAMVQSLAEGSAWCLRFENAHGYLQQGDVHFFVDTNGNSQIAIDVLPDGKIYEMQRRYQQDGTVPIPYAVPIAQYLKENKFTGRERQVEDALKAKPEYDRQKIVFAKMAEEGNIIGIFKELNINVTVKEDGTYMIQSYTAFIPNKKYTISDLQIDKDKSFEDILFENVSEVRYTLNLNGSALKSAAKLKKVGSDINFGDNKANDLSSLEEINNKKVYWDK